MKKKFSKLDNLTIMKNENKAVFAVAFEEIEADGTLEKLRAGIEALESESSEE
jgi:hypothetical protein